MKNLIIRIGATASLLLIGFTFIVLGTEWKKVDVGFDECRIDFVHTVGKYQLAFEREGAVYRREAGEDKWNIVVTEDEEFPKNSKSYPSYRLQIINGQSAIFAEDSKRTFYSRDSGATWVENFPGFDIRDEVTCHRSGHHWYRFNIYNTGVLYSNDMNLTWKEILVDQEGDKIFKISCDNYRTWVGGWGKAYWCYSSINWKTVTVGLPERCAVRTIKGINDSIVLASTDLGLYVSTNVGESWKVFDDSFSQINKKLVSDIKILDSIAILETEQGIFKADIFNDTISKIDFPFNNNLTQQDIDIFDGKLVVVNHYGIYESDDYGLTWSSAITEGLSRKVKVIDIYKENNSIIAEIEAHPYGEDSSETILSRSQDGGSTWELIENSIGKDTIKQEEVFHNGDTIFYLFNQRLLRSFDNGITLDSINNKDRPTCGGFLKIGDRIIYTTSPVAMGDKSRLRTYDQYGDREVGFRIAASNGVYFYHDTIWAQQNEDSYRYSIDSGTTWSEEMVFPEIHINSIVQFGDFAVGVSNSAMHYSIDGGYSWNYLEIPIELSTYKSMANIVPVRKGEPVIIIDSTLFIYNEDEVYSIAISKIPDLSPNKIVKTYNKSLPIEISINPSSIKLKFNKSISSNYNMKLLSINGREIKRFTGTLTNGVSQLTLDCSGISRGFYIFQMEAKGISFSKSILLTR